EGLTHRELVKRAVLEDRELELQGSKLQDAVLLLTGGILNRRSDAGRRSLQITVHGQADVSPCDELKRSELASQTRLQRNEPTATREDRHRLEGAKRCQRNERSSDDQVARNEPERKMKAKRKSEPRRNLGHRGVESIIPFAIVGRAATDLRALVDD